MALILLLVVLLFVVGAFDVDAALVAMDETPAEATEGDRLRGVLERFRDEVVLGGRTVMEGAVNVPSDGTGVVPVVVVVVVAVMLVVGVGEDIRGIAKVAVSSPDITGSVVTEDASLSPPAAIFAFFNGRSSSSCCLSFQLGCRLRVKYDFL